MKKPRLTKKIAAGISIITSLAGEDMAADERRDWGPAKDALDYLENLRAWYHLKPRPKSRAKTDNARICDDGGQSS